MVKTVYYSLRNFSLVISRVKAGQNGYTQVYLLKSVAVVVLYECFQPEIS